ncbi:MAG TPA: CRISPR-associated endonuclease Cas2 [Candidatus Kapabacteria bacterium]|nr:CRISPR-associated endonuclease Cas2 [Candidatus Kapabacteria bacterium]HOM06013.1 CRISPR-associated endonuclease Cas2 [Candidatus Kapabacteria bacterium]
MFCIVVYDVGEKRVGKMLKLTRQYFSWIQNSVFEGETTDARLLEYLHKAEKIIKKDEDSIIVFKMSTNKYLDREIIGIDKSRLTTNII